MARPNHKVFNAEVARLHEIYQSKFCNVTMQITADVRFNGDRNGVQVHCLDADIQDAQRMIEDKRKTLEKEYQKFYKQVVKTAKKFGVYELTFWNFVIDNVQWDCDG